jgi:hypothetical protein
VLRLCKKSFRLSHVVNCPAAIEQTIAKDERPHHRAICEPALRLPDANAPLDDDPLVVKWSIHVPDGIDRARGITACQMRDEVVTRDDGGRVVARNELSFGMQCRDVLSLLTAFRPLEELPRQPFGIHDSRLSEDSLQCVLAQAHAMTVRPRLQEAARPHRADRA